MDLLDAVKFGTLKDVEDALAASDDCNQVDANGFSTLRLAVNAGCLQMVNLLLQAGAKVVLDNDGNTAVCEAIAAGRIDMLELLLAHVGHIQGQCDCGNYIAKATLCHHPNVVEYLTNRGGEVNSFNHDGFTPLMLAVGNGALNVVPTLLRRGAALELRDRNHGLTAYLHAAVVGDLFAAKLLAAAGADINALDDQGFSASALAAQNGHRWTS